MWSRVREIWRKRWPLILVGAVVVITIIVWWYPMGRSTDSMDLLTLISAAASIVAAAFAAQVAFAQTATPDVFLDFEPITRHRNKVTLEVGPSGESQLPLVLNNRGKATAEKAYVRLSFPSNVQVQTRAIHRRPPKGLLEVVSPDLAPRDDNPQQVEGWIKTEIWPDMRLQLGDQNNIWIDPGQNSEIEVTWEVQTASSHAKGTAEVRFAPPQ